MDETLALLKVLTLADKEIETGETVPIEEVIKEFGVEAKRLEPGKCEEGWDDKGKKSTPV
jgi:hypothetical protein